MGFEFGAVVAFAVVAIGFAAVGLTAGRFLRPNFPDAAKATIYECGEKPIGTAWMNFNPRFYLIALVFVIFEVDIALTFPVVAVFREWVATSPAMGGIALVELLLFTLILVAGLVWAWVHGDLDWVKKLAEVDERPERRSPGGRRAA
ncbi:MAG TPA: NADH-quinone oxidoreductase subunit A [Anaeromyxobacteraceae bacterium]|nr:NADH-quinone oxidoreductase subunit A [Anaeromyxobacteraceae bacterium]